jgi:hypothetical protein
MAELHLENVPDDVVRQIEQLAEREHRQPGELAVRLLQDAVGQAVTRERQRVMETLERIRQNPIIPPGDIPDSVDLLREDRNR